MARAAKRKVQVNNAASMAERRDAGLIRAMRFKDISKIMNDIGPGDPDGQSKSYQIDMDAQFPDLIATFTWCFLEVLHFDMMYPSYFTPHKVSQWKDIATEIYQKNKEREDVYKAFSRISRQMGMAEKRIVDLIHFEAAPEELQYALYDIVLKISMDHNLELKGLLPTQ
jgi:hypothetical protein